MSIRNAARAFRPSLVCLALAGVLALSGCGKSTATVTGVVKYKGEPLPSGTVLIYGSSGEPARGPIGEDGKYTVTDAPLGEVKIAIQVQDIAAAPTGAVPGGPGGMGGQPRGGEAMGKGVPGAAEHMKPMPGSDRKVVQIPPQYSSPDSSGLSTTVKKGKQTFPIDLE